jgi:hypothetical protein
VSAMAAVAGGRRDGAGGSGSWTARVACGWRREGVAAARDRGGRARPDRRCKAGAAMRGRSGSAMLEAGERGWRREATLVAAMARGGGDGEKTQAS